MITKTWVEKQVAYFSAKTLRLVLKRQRIKWEKPAIVELCWAIWQQQHTHQHFKTLYHQGSWKISYSAFMYDLHALAPLWKLLESVFRQQHQIRFDDLTIADSSLLPSKEEASITKEDWALKRATKRTSGKTTQNICGEKLLVFLNSNHQLVFSELLPTITSSDMNVLKNPYQWALKGLRRGVFLVDRGFSCKAVRDRIQQLHHRLSDYTLKIISPYKKNQKKTLTDEEKALYSKRWQVETVFQKLKNSLGEFKLSMKGVRKASMREARVAIATLAWNARTVTM